MGKRHNRHPVAVAYCLRTCRGGNNRLFRGSEETQIPTLILRQIFKNLHFKLGHYLAGGRATSVARPLRAVMVRRCVGVFC